MPGKDLKLIGKTLHTDGYYEAVAIIPTPGFVLVKEVEAEAKTAAAAAVVSTHHHSSSSDYYSSSYSFQSKLDATKRKMHDSYQQLANAKKQRMIQIIDPRELPPPPTQSSSKLGAGVAARSKTKKMITSSNRKTIRSNGAFFDGRGGRSKLMKPTSIF